MLKFLVIILLTLSAFITLHLLKVEWLIKVIGTIIIALVSLIFERIFSSIWSVSTIQSVNQGNSVQPLTPVNRPIPSIPTTPNISVPNIGRAASLDPTMNNENLVGRGSLLNDQDVDDVNNNRAPVKNSVLKPCIYRKSMCIRLWWERFAVYVEANKFARSDLVNIFKSFLDDECLLMAKYGINDIDDLETLRRRVMKLFDTFSGEVQIWRSRFYSRIQLPDEDLRVFMTQLWRTAEEAFVGKSRSVRDGAVRDQFVFGLSNKFIKHELKQLSIGRVLTAEEVLDYACQEHNTRYGSTDNTDDYVASLSAVRPRRSLNGQPDTTSTYNQFQNESFDSSACNSPHTTGQIANNCNSSFVSGHGILTNSTPTQGNHPQSSNQQVNQQQFLISNSATTDVYFSEPQ